MPSKSKAKASGTKDQLKSSGSKHAVETSSVMGQTNSTKAPNGNEAKQSASKASSVVSAIHGPSDAVQRSVPDYVPSEVSINRKKQKRRLKEAAKKAAGQAPMTEAELAQQFADVTGSEYQDIIKAVAAAKANGEEANGYDYGASDYDDPDRYDPDEGDDDYYTDEANGTYPAEYATAAPRTNGYAPHNHDPRNLPGGSKSKKDGKAGYAMANTMPLSTPGSLQRPPPPPPPPATQSSLASTSHAAHHVSKDRIWNTSTAEERERIKEFWLSLGEEDRRSLVKVEKEAVLKKMKEQQKHSCSCTVCGRKRTAIEEELEVLYDAYYEELEQYANHQQINIEDGTPIIPPPRMYGHPMSRIPPSRHPQLSNGRSSKGRFQEVGDEDAGDEEYSEDEEEDDVSDDDEMNEPPPGTAGDFFNFGNSLTVQGGILTVADDLLKNDGKKFIEMMEQLAERRMQREEEAQMTAAGMGHPSMHHGPPEDDDGYDDEEDDEEYDSQEEDEFDEEEMETMTEEQRMEEGRRMFQIFAARMFEQRVLTAYREKVALERQQKLIEELDDESRVDAQREAKKAKEAQKKKDKKRQQKLAKDEEKAKREAERGAEEAAAKALEEKKAEEQRQKKEEQRRKREAEKKALEEERQRKEAEKLRQIQERKEQQAEQERKQREAKEREKKKREEVKKKEREEREVKEKEAREKKGREAANRRDREPKAKAEKDTKEPSKKEETVVQQAAPSIPIGQSPANAPSTATPLLPGLNPTLTTSQHASPRPLIATPVLPKAPTPVRARQSSFQESRNTSSRNSQAASASSTASPATSSGHPNDGAVFHTRKTSQAAPIQPPQSHSQYSPMSAPLSGITQPPGFSSMSSAVGNAYPPPFGPPVASQVPPTPGLYSTAPGAHPYRNIMPPNGMPFGAALNGIRQFPQGRSGSMDPTGAQSPIGAPSHINNDFGHFGMPRDAAPSHTHSRNTSTSSNVGAGNPIARPAPIKRPSSVTPHQQNEKASARPSNADVDELSNHLGSSALIDDDDMELSANIHDSRGSSMAVGGPRAGRQAFNGAPSYQDSMSQPRVTHINTGNTWPTPSVFGAPHKLPSQTWSNAPGFGRPTANSGFGLANHTRPPPVAPTWAIRARLCNVCERLSARSPAGANQRWLNTNDVLRELNALAAPGEIMNKMDMIGICDTKGTVQNGGGTFETTSQDGVGLIIRYIPSGNGTSSNGGVPGEIGSPIMGPGAMPSTGSRAFQQPGGFSSAMGF